MLKEQARGTIAVARDFARTLQAFGRAVRARQLYRSNNVMYSRVMQELGQSFEALLAELSEISLKVRPDAIFYQDERVLEEPNPDESIPFLFYRDGVRRIDLSEGLSAEELEVLVTATAESITASGFGDDIVSFLWRHDLEHIHTVVVDTAIVDAVSQQTASIDNEAREKSRPIENEIESLLALIYGTTSADVGHDVAHVDLSDFGAKKIAETLDAVDEMAPGFHPSRAFLEPPAYAADLRAELAAEDERRITFRAVLAALNALAASLRPEDAAPLLERLLQLYDAALMSGSFRIAARIFSGVRHLESFDVARAYAQAWLEQAMVEARLRQCASALEKQTNADEAQAIAELFRSAGRRVVPTLLSMIPAIEDPKRRRFFSDLSAEIGIDDLTPIQEMLASPQAFVGREAVYLLAKLAPAPDAVALLRSLETHPLVPLRQALLAVCGRVGREEAVELARRMLDHPEPEVIVAAARALAQLKEPRAGGVLGVRVQRPEFQEAPREVKQAILSAYMVLAPKRAGPVLAQMLRDGGSVLATHESEDLAVCAAHALSLAGAPVIGELEKATQVRNKRVKEAALAALKRAKGEA